MNQQPVTFPVQPPNVPTLEGVALFNAGIVWLAIAGFPQVDLRVTGDHSVPTDDRRDTP
jgi:hypothetical protein